MPPRNAFEWPTSPAEKTEQKELTGVSFLELVLAADIKDTPKEGVVRVNGDKIGKDGTSDFSRKSELTVNLDDGTYKRNKDGRVIETASPDGKSIRIADYGTRNDALRPESITMGGTTYKYLGPITSLGKPVTKEGYEMASWSCYDDKGKFINNWYGHLSISDNGVLTVVDERTGKRTHEGADGSKLSDAEVTKRAKEGIWPGTVEITRPDGSSMKADLKGKTVETLRETVKEGGKEVERVWHREGTKYLSNDTPERERSDIKVDGKGNLTITDTDATETVIDSNANKAITKSGVTNYYDAAGNRTGVRTSEGARTLTDNEIESTSGPYKSKWTRKPGTDEWTDGTNKEIRKNMTILPDGVIEWTNADGLKMRESMILSRTKFDSAARPTDIDFVSGASRKLKYDVDGLKTVEDHLPPKEKDKTETINTWERDGKTTDFVSTRDGQTYKRNALSVVDDGDLKYKGQDSRDHVSKSRDLDRIARGEFVLSSESLLEARHRLTESVTAAGIDSKRFEGWVKDFEAAAVKNKLDPEKVVKTMNNLSDILTATEKSPLYDKAQLTKIVDTAMHNLGRPLEIDQGNHPTCNVTSVEVYAAVRQPDQYSRLLKEIALTGKWNTFDDKTVTPPKEALIPGKDENKYDLDKPDSGIRNFASQLVQMTLINGSYETGLMNKTEKDDQTGKVTIKQDLSDRRYVMGPSRSETQWMNGQQVIVDMGEDVLMDGKKNTVNGSNGKPVHGPEMVQDDVLASAKMMFGQEPPYIRCSGHVDLPTGRQYFNYLPSKEDMLKFKKEDKLPILTPTMGGAHSQTIHDVWQDPKSGEVWILLDNQHGEPEVKGEKRTRTGVSGEGDGDGWITLNELHDTLRMAAQGAQYAKPIMPQIYKYDHPSKQK